MVVAVADAAVALDLVCVAGPPMDSLSDSIAIAESWLVGLPPEPPLESLSELPSESPSELPSESSALSSSVPPDSFPMVEVLAGPEPPGGQGEA